MFNALNYYSYPVIKSLLFKIIYFVKPIQVAEQEVQNRAPYQFFHCNLSKCWNYLSKLSDLVLTL